jgi:hypothetical protein
MDSQWRWRTRFVRWWVVSEAISIASLDLFLIVSLVDGYNLPMRIDNNKGCPVPECPVDLGPNCPAQLKGPFDSSGFPVGCKSACVANLDGNPCKLYIVVISNSIDPNNFFFFLATSANSANCCSGSHNTPQTCPSSGVAFYSYFKSNCPKAYAYAYDDATSLFTCPSNLKADYTVTFCP